MLKLVVRANARRDKAPVLLEVREELEQLKVVLRLCQDVKAFQSFKAFEHATTQVVGIAKQNEGRPAAGLTGRSCQDAEREVPVTMDQPEVLPVVGEQRGADAAR